jgi:hypothetical protein
MKKMSPSTTIKLWKIVVVFSIISILLNAYVIYLGKGVAQYFVLGSQIGLMLTGIYMVKNRQSQIPNK